MHRSKTFLSVLMIGMSLLSGCGDDEESKSTPLAVTITDVGDQVKLDLPSSVNGGVIGLTLKNGGQGPHSLQFVKIAGTHSTAEVAAFLGSSEEGGPVPDWFSEGGGIGTVAPGQTGTATFKLSEGRHIVWDDESGGPNDANNGTRGGIAELNVTGDGGGELPDADGSVSAKEYEFTVRGLKAGKTSVRFENTGKQYHHFIAAPMLPGKTLDDVKAAFESEDPSAGPPPIDFEKGVGVAVVDAGNAVVADLDLQQAGDYAMFCFVNDRAGGPPHFTKGMLQKVTVG